VVILDLGLAEHHLALGGPSLGVLESLITLHLVWNVIDNMKMMKGKALRKHSLHEKTAASVLLKLFNSGNE